MRTRLRTALLSSVLALVAMSIGISAQNADRTPSNKQPRVNGTFTDAANGQGAFSGIIRLTQFEVQGGGVVAVGTVVGALADSTGKPLGRVNQQAALSVGGLVSTCELLRVEIGPADLDILGVQVHLEKDVLEITVHDGPKQAMGSLLCSSARLLDNRPKLDAIAMTLNDVLRTMEPAR